MKAKFTKPDFSLEGFRKPIHGHFGDAWGPPQFTNWIDESLSWKETCYIGDWSFLPSVRYRGPDVLKLFADCSVNTMNNFEVGQSKHIIHCNKDGKIIEEGVLSRFGEDEYVVFSTMWADFYRRQGDYNVSAAEPLNLTKFQVQGPNSLFLMERVSGESLRDLKFMRFRKIRIAGYEVLILRQGMTGEIGFELQAPLEHGAEIWHTIVEEGKEFGIRQMGSRVAMINHLEANYPTHSLDYLSAIFGKDERPYLDELVESSGDYIQDYYRIAGSYESGDISDWYRSPVELGWANRINFDHDFLGAEALKHELASPKRKVATLVWDHEDVIGVYASLFKKDGPLPDFMEMPQEPRGYLYADKILKDGKIIGTTSSRGYSAYFREMISLCVIDLEFHQPGTEVTVVWGNPGSPQREIKARVAPAPYKTDRARVDFNTLPSTPPRGR